VIDATGCSVVPGFVDVQINGGFGIDLTGEPERIDELAAILPRTGVTAFAPTVVTAPREVRARAVAVLTTRGERAAGAARSVGVHLEGPYLNPQRKGAHPERHLRAPSSEEAAGWSAAGGVAMVTLAPELAARSTSCAS
jgi:N-acetylglucosamine-6-phosphate deacetylase